MTDLNTIENDIAKLRQNARDIQKIELRKCFYDIMDEMKPMIYDMLHEINKEEAKRLYGYWTFIINNQDKYGKDEVNYPKLAILFEGTDTKGRIIPNRTTLWNNFFNKFNYILPQDLMDLYIDYFEYNFSIVGYEIYPI